MTHRRTRITRQPAQSGPIRMTGMPGPIAYVEAGRLIMWRNDPCAIAFLRRRPSFDRQLTAAGEPTP